MNKHLNKILIGILLITLAILVSELFQTKSLIVAKNQSANNLPAPSPQPRTTIFLAGDIMLSRNVDAKITAANDPTLPFQKTSDVTKSADIAFANLESPFNNTGNHSVDGSLVFNADPKNVTGLTYAGFDVLSTANNHALDQGQTGVDLTLQILQANGIVPVGTTDSTFDLSKYIIEKNGTKFAFLSYSYTALNNGGSSTSPYIANFNDLNQLKQDIATLKTDGADVVIVNMHAGIEYTRQPTPAQVNFAHAAIDDGADLVVGEHPHWVQPTENYHGKWIFYGLGNFVFDQMWSTETRQGLTLLITYNKKEISKIELKPVIIDDYSTPHWANSDESAAILSTIGLTSPILLDNN